MCVVYVGMYMYTCDMCVCARKPYSAHQSSSLMMFSGCATTEEDPNNSRWMGSTIVMVLADTARVFNYMSRKGRWDYYSTTYQRWENFSYFFSKDKIGWGEPRVLVDEVDRWLVDEGRLAVWHQQPPLLLVETHIGVQPHAQQCSNLGNYIIITQ